MTRRRKAELCLILTGIAGLLFASYRVIIVSRAIAQLYQHGSAINTDHIPGLGPTGVTIGIHVPGQVPDVSGEDACDLLSRIHVFWRLRILNIDDVDVDPQCIISVLRQTRLTELRASGTPFDDACVLAAVKQGSLEMLSVRNTHVTPDGLRVLSSLRSLRALHIGDNGFTEAEIMALQHDLPSVTIAE